jgi:hypothetical protein
MESESIYLDDEYTSPRIINRVDSAVPEPEILKAENLIGTIKAGASPHELAETRSQEDFISNSCSLSQSPPRPVTDTKPDEGFTVVEVD